MRPAFVVLFGLLGPTLLGCTAFGAPEDVDTDAAPLRGFGVDVVQAVSDRVPLVHVKTCGDWGCYEQNVELFVSGPVSPLPCETPEGGSKGEAACGTQQLDGPGPGFGYVSVPKLTTDPVTVTVTTPAGAKFPIDSEVRVRPRWVCPSVAENANPDNCSGGAAQADLRIDADGQVSQSR